ncbi:putative glycosyltransferase EpsF [bioreactor metagenome]|uniref:Putative glycosyltransferase EpsF n=1 Tax=bioreactor metagenome TaxID=1076179 RepID=A0A645JK53_9ZZZZ
MLLSAFDLFTLPSRFEGLGIVLIEAQASGLGCVASCAVPRDTQIVSCEYLPLSDSALWAEAFVRTSESANRELPERALAERGYEIASAAAELQTFYERAAGRI